MTFVLDASAVLTVLLGEQGGEEVRPRLHESVISAANMSEVLSRMSGVVERSLTEAILVSEGLRVEPVTLDDARVAAKLRDANPALSLGDRLCLALSKRLSIQVLTADRAWGSTEQIIQIR